MENLENGIKVHGEEDVVVTSTLVFPLFLNLALGSWLLNICSLWGAQHALWSSGVRSSGASLLRTDC
jgi:hypothetical protein